MSISESETSSGLANSFTDLMTSLAVIFILLLCASLNNAFEEGQSTRNNILEKLRKELNEYVIKGIKIEADPKDPLALLILVPEGLLAFQVDKAEIPEQGIPFLISFVPKLASITCAKDFKDEISTVVVEGHTDSSGDDRHNWELSQKRSMAVVSESLDVLENIEEEDGLNLKDEFQKFISASGRGSKELILIDGKEDMALSRRVVFKIRVRSFEEKTVKKIVGLQK